MKSGNEFGTTLAVAALCRFSAILVAVLVFPVGSVFADVWQSTADWSDSAETRYAEWIHDSFDESFFLQGDWAGIETDCADAVYGSRIIFSYVNGLPFSLSTTDIKVSNASRDFDKIEDPIQRVRAFLAYVNNRTWTGTLAKHTYPVAITRSAVVPGVIWLKPGHVETVRSVRDTGVVELRGSWLPAAIRKMITVTQLGNVPRNPNHGFRRWIWPQNLSKPVAEQPGYESRQQALTNSPNAGDEGELALTTSVSSHKVTALELYYDVSKFEFAVQEALRLRSEKVSERIERLALDFCALVKSRSDVVRSGYNFSVQLGRCMNEKEYFAYSTPSRDSNLRRVVIGLGLEFENNLNQVRSQLAKCEPVAISATKAVSPFDFFRHLLTLNYSSNPHESPATRFGLAPLEHACASSEVEEIYLKGIN